jgi:hypothetical protein
VNNPANVFYVDKDISIFVAPVLTGTLAIKAGKKISMSGNLTITPAVSDMPALVAAGRHRVRKQCQNAPGERCRVRRRRRER